MAVAFQQRRRRDIMIGVLGMIGILCLLLGRNFVEAITGPNIPGYAQQAPAGSFVALDWQILQQGRWDDGKPPVVPTPLHALAGKKVRLRGFLLPLHSATAAQFFISEKPRGCFFCYPPGIAEVVQLNIAGGKQLEITGLPVTAYGTLHPAVDAKTDAALYTMNDTILVAGR